MRNAVPIGALAALVASLLYLAWERHRQEAEAAEMAAAGHIAGERVDRVLFSYSVKLWGDALDARVEIPEGTDVIYAGCERLREPRQPSSFRVSLGGPEVSADATAPIMVHENNWFSPGAHTHLALLGSEPSTCVLSAMTLEPTR